MRNNAHDGTIEKNYVQKWRFMIKEYELIKAGQHATFNFVCDFYRFHGINQQTFIKYYNRFKNSGNEADLLPRKRGPKWKTRRPLPHVENMVIKERLKGNNRYEICDILRPKLKRHTPSP